MELKKIFIVEDEAIVARDIELRLKAMGYEVVGIAASGEKAIELINTTSPDFVLMDIHLKGKMDGIETAEIVRKTHDIPIVFLTAFADNPTLERAKATDPFGYILKPFEERALQIHIEIAFHKYETEKRIKNREKWIESVLNSIGEAIVATDPEGIINFANPAAADLLGARQDNLIGKSALDTIIFCDEMKTPAINPLSIVLTKGTAQMSDNSQLQYDKEAFITVSFSAVPLQNHLGQLTGAVLGFRDISSKRRAERELHFTQKEFEARLNDKVKIFRERLDRYRTQLNLNRITIKNLKKVERKYRRLTRGPSDSDE